MPKQPLTDTNTHSSKPFIATSNSRQFSRPQLASTSNAGNKVFNFPFAYGTGEVPATIATMTAAHEHTGKPPKLVVDQTSIEGSEHRMMQADNSSTFISLSNIASFREEGPNENVF